MTKKELRGLICSTLNMSKVPHNIENQITRFVTEQGLTYKQIARALVFFIDVEKGTYEQRYGLGIIPSVVERADAYYEGIKRRRERQKQSIESAKKYPDIILEAGQLKRRRKLPQIDMEKIEVD